MATVLSATVISDLLAIPTRWQPPPMEPGGSENRTTEFLRLPVELCYVSGDKKGGCLKRERRWGEHPEATDQR
ncbi:MAG: hypothetical protein PHP75_06185 [Methylacidiphilaceae bacterium]|nr:hypothetical protein [Candidatus Methylacidiphilaceae bacterium]